MRYSIMIMPALQLSFGVLNRVAGPQKTIAVSHRAAKAVLAVIPRRREGFAQDDLVGELKFVRKFTIRPFAACLETACAFEQWLAFQGEPCIVRLGKRVESKGLLMHAWVETANASFFKDSRFQPCFA